MLTESQAGPHRELDIPLFYRRDLRGYYLRVRLRPHRQLCLQTPCLPPLSKTETERGIAFSPSANWLEGVSKEDTSMYVVSIISKRDDKTYFNKCGVGWKNKDGSINFKLDIHGD